MSQREGLEHKTHHSGQRVTDLREGRKKYLPFEFVESGDLDLLGFTKDESEQRVEYPHHMNVPTRIYFDASCHDVLLQRDADGRTSLLLVPKAGLSISRID